MSVARCGLGRICRLTGRSFLLTVLVPLLFNCLSSARLDAAAQLTLRQAVSVQTPDGFCENDNPTYICTVKPQSMTLNFSPTLSNSALLVAALDGVAGCKDNLGQSWVGSQTWQTRQFVSGYHFFVPADGAVQAGLTSIACDVSTSFTDMLANFGHGSIGGDGEQIIQFFEVATSDSGAKVVGTVSGIYPVPTTFVAAVPPANGAALVGVTTDEYYEHISGAVIGIGGIAATDAGALQAWSNCTGPCKPYESFMETTWGVDDGSGTQIGRTCPSDNQFFFSQQCAAAFIVRFQTSQVTLQLTTGTGTGPGDPTSVSKTVSGTMTARYPLGSTFFLGLTKNDQNGNPVPVSSTFSISAVNVAPSINEPTLFAGTVVLGFGGTAASQTKFFQTVHLGTATITLTPTGDPSATPVTVQIQINRPQSLGTTNLTQDSLLIDFAHRRGVPPQFLKGQVQRESSFNANSYRYEVLSIDRGTVTGGANLRVSTPYSLYRLRTSDGLAAGTDLAPVLDVQPRSFPPFPLNIIRNGQRRVITVNDQLVTARELYTVNDGVQHWSRFNPVPAAAFTADPTILDFTAQTTIAASYGLFQILYTTTIRTQGWQGVGGHRNPHYLLDPLENATLSTGYLRRIYSDANTTAAAVNGQFAGSAQFREAFLRTFNWYNHNGPAGAYGNTVMTNAGSYTPQPSTSILPQ